MELLKENFVGFQEYFQNLSLGKSDTCNLLLRSRTDSPASVLSSGGAAPCCQTVAPGHWFRLASIMKSGLILKILMG
jgi:hypothetical protein